MTCNSLSQSNVKCPVCSRRVRGWCRPWWWRNRSWTTKWRRWRTEFRWGRVSGYGFRLQPSITLQIHRRPCTFFFTRWQIRALRTWKISRMSTTLNSTPWETEVRRDVLTETRSHAVENADSQLYSWFFREWNERHDSEGAGEREVNRGEDVPGAESQKTGEQTEPGGAR